MAKDEPEIEIDWQKLALAGISTWVEHQNTVAARNKAVFALVASYDTGELFIIRFRSRPTVDENLSKSISTSLPGPSKVLK